MHLPRRGTAAISLMLALTLMLSGCAVRVAPPARIRFVASDVMPFPPASSVWYSSATLHAKEPFARWEQARDRIELVTWPHDCAHVPVAISFTPSSRPVDVGMGRAPRSEGPRQCSAGHVLTSTFVGSRALRRDRPTILRLDGEQLVLPPAPAMVTEPVPLTASSPDTPHPLRQLDRPLPQYSVRDYPWILTGTVSPDSTRIPIGWVGGTCDTNASRVYVVETVSSVTIDTALAPPPLRPHPTGGRSVITCAGVGVLLSATIHLSRPLGSRTLLQHQYVRRPADLNAY